MNIKDTRTHVVIVGGGMAGLSAACYLAHAGISVTLFEKAAKLGGRAASQNHEGYHFNRGIHALYTGGETSEVLQELGISYTYGSPKETFLLRQGKIYPFPASVSSLLASRLISFADKLELAGFFSSISKLKPKALASISVQQWLNQTFKRPQVRQLMTSTAYVQVYSSALDLVSAEVLVAKLQRTLKHPVHYIEGGWQTLVDGLHQVAEQAGVRIVNGTRVTSAITQQGRIEGVKLNNGDELSVSAVILATNPADALKLVDGGDYAPLRAIVEPLIPARVACLDVALKYLPDPRYPVVQDVEHPRFFSAQSSYTRVTPEGGALISAFKQLDPLNLSDQKQDERDLEEFLDTAQPGWRELVVKRVFLPRIEAIGMLPTARGGGYAGRPTSEVPGIANLYLAGDWIGTGFLSDPSMGSGRQAARLIIQSASRTKVEAAR